MNLAIYLYIYLSIFSYIESTEDLFQALEFYIHASKAQPLWSKHTLILLIYFLVIFVIKKRNYKIQERKKNDKLW